MPTISLSRAPPADVPPRPSLLPLPPPQQTQELNDRFKGEETDPNEEDPKRARFRRACLVISGAEGIGLAPLIRANHITGRAHLYNIAFVAQLLNRRPRIHRESLHLDASVKMQVGLEAGWGWGIVRGSLARGAMAVPSNDHPSAASRVCWRTAAVVRAAPRVSWRQNKASSGGLPPTPRRELAVVCLVTCHLARVVRAWLLRCVEWCSVHRWFGVMSSRKYSNEPRLSVVTFCFVL